MNYDRVCVLAWNISFHHHTRTGKTRQLGVATTMYYTFILALTHHALMTYLIHMFYNAEVIALIGAFWAVNHDYKLPFDLIMGNLMDFRVYDQNNHILSG